MKAQRGSGDIFLLWMGVGGQRHARLEDLALPEFDPRSVQPVVSRYTDWAIPAYKVLRNVGRYLPVDRACFPEDLGLYQELPWFVVIDALPMEAICLWLCSPCVMRFRDCFLLIRSPGLAKKLGNCLSKCGYEYSSPHYCLFFTSVSRFVSCRWISLNPNTIPKLWYLQTFALCGLILEGQSIWPLSLSCFKTLVKCLAVTRVDHQRVTGSLGWIKDTRYTAGTDGHSSGDNICFTLSRFILRTLLVVQTTYVYS
jgi:hypothetical protein